MRTIILLIAFIAEIAFAGYCTITSSHQEMIRSYICIGAFAVFEKMNDLILKFFNTCLKDEGEFITVGLN